MDRLNTNALSAAVAAATAVSFSLSAIGVDKGLKFQAFVTCDGEKSVICDDAGKIKTYSDVDSFVKVMSAAAPSSDGSYELTVETGTILLSALAFDQDAADLKEVAKLTTRKAEIVATKATVVAALAARPTWATGNALQVAWVEELSAQRDAMTAAIAAIDARVTALS